MWPGTSDTACEISVMSKNTSDCAIFMCGVMFTHV